MGSFIFGLPASDGHLRGTREQVRGARAHLASCNGDALARALIRGLGEKCGRPWARVSDIPVTRHWLIPQAQRPKVYAPHPVMTPDEIRARTQAVWDRFYSLPRIWARSRCTRSLRARLAFVLISKLYRQMYANTGIATDSARVNRANRWARVIAKPCRAVRGVAPTDAHAASGPSVAPGSPLQ